MTTKEKSKRLNQSRRTRKDLLTATARLLKEGRKPNIEEIAEEALVSRATAYRYFPNVEALLAEALFADDSSTDPLDRIERAEAAMHESVYKNEGSLRLMLASTLALGNRVSGSGEIPVRQNRRSPLIQAALSPVRNQLDAPTHEKLCSALALVFGTEAMIVFRDILQLDEEKARKVKSWAVRALVRAALEESKSKA
jgi:AcrR family transcriptional regulator